ncbi:uncharacterized protein JN550_009635 [Neoarthrinium moseri]|uniref:uncharacterized protein n=1 Tax=Neoarthrinium moseri TaxID=1658444 RepID=UPI001FDD99B5|nr:uncharacterized protein JN550_009635 [Neoarthrinium moseri]KAI1863315.1 hypothetical protein JN550_009635 [Neoarthrinium moseri]
MSEATAQLELIRKRVTHAETDAKVLRRRLSRLIPDAWDRIRDLEEQNGRFPPLPARLPRADYVLVADSLERDKQALLFYVACEQGALSDVVAFVEERTPNPSKATLQFGLEQASFACKPDVVQYLLHQGATLHSGCFMKLFEFLGAGQTSTRLRCIFDEADYAADTDSFIALLSVFIKSGFWHPNQPWESPAMIDPYVAMYASRVLTDRRLLLFLLEHGADPNLSRYPKSARGSSDRDATPWAIDRQSPSPLNLAVAQGDQSLFDLLVAHGAKAEGEGLHLLHSLVRAAMQHDFASTRRPMAEGIIAQRLADVNDVKPMPYRHEDSRYFIGGYTEDETPLTLACAASDWEFVEWLVQHGADPGALGGKAYTQLWWNKPYGANDPSRLLEILNSRAITEAMEGMLDP